MICHEYKCIFVHVPKNAGQSIEHVFLDRLGVTWKDRSVLTMGSNDRPELGPPRLAHLKASEYVACKHISKEQFESYFKFAFVRNPWDRMVSMYKYLGRPDKQTFKDFLFGPFRNDIWRDKPWFVGPQSAYVFDAEGTSLVDFVGRFESLQEDFDRVCHELGLPAIPVPHVNKSQATDSAHGITPGRLWRHCRNALRARRARRNVTGHYTTFYDRSSEDLVAELYAADILRFGYEFAGPPR